MKKTHIHNSRFINVRQGGKMPPLFENAINIQQGGTCPKCKCDQLITYQWAGDVGNDVVEAMIETANLFEYCGAWCSCCHFSNAAVREKTS